MDNNIFQIIESIEEDKYKAEFEFIKSKILESLSDDSEDISFESIVKGDNFIKSTLSKIFKNIFNVNRSAKINFDFKSFKKIDKSKIKKDVTGIANLNYVTNFCKIMSQPLLNETDSKRLSELLNKFKEGMLDEGFQKLLKHGSLSVILINIVSLISGLAIDIVFSLVGMVTALLYYAIIIIYAISLPNYKGTISFDEIREMVDLIAKLLNVYIGNGDSKVVDDSSFKAVRNATASLNIPNKSVISVSDQEKIADILSDLANSSNHKEVLDYKQVNRMDYISEFVLKIDNSNIQNDTKLLKKLEDISFLIEDVSEFSDAIVEASNTIMRDIRKW